MAPSSPHRVAARPTLVIAMLTYRRPEKLEHGLDLVIRHARDVSRAGLASASVLVIDNDPLASARETVGARVAADVLYVCEPTPGIAAARNRALDEAAAADLLVFIDDDECAESDWLRSLLTTWSDTGAAAVMGRVVSKFETEVPAFVEAGRFFQRRRLLTGTRVPVVAAGNLLLDLRQVRESGIRFDEDLGLGGGEDTLFSRRLHHLGYPMVWCDESVAVDFVPADRLTRRWVLMRSWSHGLNTGRFDVLLAAPGLPTLVARLGAIVRGSVRVGGGAAQWLVGVLIGSLVHRARGLRALQRGRGMVAGASGRRFEEYARRSL